MGIRGRNIRLAIQNDWPLPMGLNVSLGQPGQADRAAIRDAEQAVRNFVEFNLSPMDSLARTSDAEKQRLVDAGYGFYASDIFTQLGDLSYRELLDAGIVYVGTPEKVAEDLLALWQEFHFQELIIMSYYGGIERWKAMRTQELFAKRVMPVLQQAVD